MNTALSQFALILDILILRVVHASGPRLSIYGLSALAEGSTDDDPAGVHSHVMKSPRIGLIRWAILPVSAVLSKFYSLVPWMFQHCFLVNSWSNYLSVSPTTLSPCHNTCQSIAWSDIVDHSSLVLLFLPSPSPSPFLLLIFPSLSHPPFSLHFISF